MVTVEDLEEQARRAGIRIAEIPLKNGLMGYYAPDKKLIVLSAALSARQKRSALAHELQHALNDDQGCGAGAALWKSDTPGKKPRWRLSIWRILRPQSTHTRGTPIS